MSYHWDDWTGSLSLGSHPVNTFSSSCSVLLDMGIDEMSVSTGCGTKERKRNKRLVLIVLLQGRKVYLLRSHFMYCYCVLSSCCDGKE